MNNNADYFQRTQEHERKRITSIYVNYFQKKNCTCLTLTSLEDFNKIDALMISGSTMQSKPVAIEYKNRYNNVFTYNSALIEFSKYEALYTLYKAGFQVFFINEYKDGYILILDMNKVFNDRSNAKLDHYFYINSMNANSSGNSYNKEKQVTQIDYSPYTYIVLNSDFKAMSFQDLVKIYFQEKQ